MSNQFPRAPRVLIARARSLKNAKRRAEEGRTLVDTPRAVREVLRAGGAIDAILTTREFATGESSLVGEAEKSGVAIYLVEDKELARIASTKTHQGVVAVVPFQKTDRAAITECSSIIALDAVQDPGNVGTLVRSADCFGVGVLLGTGCADIFNPKVIRASAGSVFRAMVASDIDLTGALSTLRSAGYRLIGTNANARTSYREFRFPSSWVLVMGNEASGLSEETEALLDDEISIPMQGPGQSLNVAIAGSILLAQATRTSRPELDMAEVVSAVNHDLRSPLTAIKGFAATMESRWERLEENLKREMVTQIAKSADRLSRTIGELVDTARIETGELRCIPVSFEVKSVVSEVVNHVRGEFPEVHFESDLTELEGMISADLERFRETIEMLVQNACKHGRNNVCIRGARSGNWVTIEVLDDGVDFDATRVELAMRGRIGKDRRSAQLSGAGLALHVAAEVASMQGGELSVERVGDHTVFRLRVRSHEERNCESYIGEES